MKRIKLKKDHWRLRLVYWLMSDPPDFLVKKYCPLFHFTNLMVCFLPLFIAAKVVKNVAAYIINFISKICDEINKNKQETSVLSGKSKEQEFLDFWIFDSCYYSDFKVHGGSEQLEDYLEDRLSVSRALQQGLDEQIVKLLFKERIEKERVVILAGIEKRKKRDALIASISQKSCAFFRVFFKIIYAAIFLFSIYLFTLVDYIGVAKYLWNSIMGIDYFYVVKAIFSVIGIVIAIGSFVYGLVKFCPDLTVPVKITTQVTSKAIHNTASTVSHSASFAGGFLYHLYSDNCPAVEIEGEDERS